MLAIIFSNKIFNNNNKNFFFLSDPELSSNVKSIFEFYQLKAKTIEIEKLT